MIEVKIDVIRQNNANSRVVILKEAAGQRFLPIWIGEPEANSISAQINGIRLPRPITHDLAVRILREVGATVRYVLVTEMRDETFYARILLVAKDGREISLDSRPSDAFAIAVRCDCPIYVAEDVMNAHAQEPTEDVAAVADEDLGAFKDFLGSLDLDDLDDEEKNK